MKLELQTKTEKQNFTGLLLLGNFLGGATSFVLLMIQFIYFPQYFGVIWTFVLAIAIAIAYFNLRAWRTSFKLKSLWHWLKVHQ